MRLLVSKLSSYRLAGTRAQSTFKTFDRTAKILQKDRNSLDGALHRKTDYLKDLAAEGLVERYLDIKRSFGKVLDLGSGAGQLARLLDKDLVKEFLISIESSRGHLFRKEEEEDEAGEEGDAGPPVQRAKIVCDEESFYPLQRALGEDVGELDAVLSNMSLHWINDLPGLFIQVGKVLKNDGLFLASMFGQGTLFELRTSLQLAEQAIDGRISPRVSPLTTSRDIGALLSRTGFNLTTVDVDEVVVQYPSIFELMQDLRLMGESNAILNRPSMISRDILIAADAIYKEMHGNEDGTIPATFAIIYLIGWKPDASQPKPLERGSATHRLAESLGFGDK